MPDSVPTFPGYDSVAFHAKGGSAIVWKARQISLDRDVAIKQLRPDLCGGDDDVDRFLAEARALGKMSHPNIVRCIDAFHRDNRFCFVMEFIERGTIAEHVVRNERLDERECLAIAAAVASALGYAWTRHNAVHCDIKPANIMVASDNSLKITDFGISQSLTRRLTGTVSPHQSGEIEVFGTPNYMAPEQVAGSQSLGPQCDMYALGATLYYCVAGWKLFHDLDEDAAMDAQITGQSVDLADFVPDVSFPFCALVEKLLAKNPADRHGSWEEVAAEIAEVEAGNYGGAATFAAPSTIARGAARPPPPKPGFLDRLASRLKL
ncbi:MAG: serine/threonine protein kinase [Kiritimatiellaeota bacterium]|nr:serine/threonine protein kinase [Kiritimatiellota bacterium]